MLPDIPVKKMSVYQLPVISTAFNSEPLLKVPEILSKMGKIKSLAIYDTLQEVPLFNFLCLTQLSIKQEGYTTHVILSNKNQTVISYFLLISTIFMKLYS